jgi:hypothetical protein
MTVANMLNDFENITLDDRNRGIISKTPTKSFTAANPVSPESDSSVSSSSDNEEERLVASSMPAVTVSEHKLAELEGRHLEEPLLKENPGRFVLFPIKEEEVS